MATSTIAPRRTFAQRVQADWLSHDTRLGYLFNLPALIVIFVVVGYPIIQTFWFSLHRYTLGPPRFEYIGLGQYVTALSSPPLLEALRFSMFFTLLSVPLIVLGGVGGALVLNEAFPGRSLVRGLIVIPWAIPAVVTGAMWSFIFNSKYGALNGVLYTFGFINDYRSWLLDPWTAIPALVIAHVWSHLPFAIIVCLAALQAIPADMYEAARVAGPGCSSGSAT